MFQDLLSTTDAYLGLCALGTQGAAGVESYVNQLEEQQRTFTSGFGPLGKNLGELLPFPLELAKPFLDTLGSKTLEDVLREILFRLVALVDILVRNFECVKQYC